MQDKLFARMIFLCLLPFAFSSNLFLRAFISEGLRVVYTPPGKDLLRGRLLEEEDAAVQARVDAYLEETEYRQVTSDGRSNIRGGSIISYVATCPLGDFFIHSTDASLVEKKSADWCFSDFVKRTDQCGGVDKINGFISGTENKMRALWKKIEEKYPTIHQTPTAHPKRMRSPRRGQTK